MASMTSASPLPAATIRPAEEADLPAFFAYLDDHLRDNGVDGTPRFQPIGRDQLRTSAGLRLSFIKGLVIPVGEPGWRRLWLALDVRGNIAGHIDLRSRPEAAAKHRAMLGIGVHRLYRRGGIGARLIDIATEWACDVANLDWIDLEVLSGNVPACELYLRTGFSMIARITDMLRIDGVDHDLIYMTRALR